MKIDPATIAVGDTLHVTRTDPRHSGDPAPVTVTKIGRTLLTIEHPGGHAEQYRLDTGHQNTRGGAPAYLRIWTEQTLAEHQRTEAATQRIRDAHVGVGRIPDAPADDLEALAAIYERIRRGEPAEPPVLTWTIETDDDQPTSRCPHCGAHGTIREVDAAERWNRLDWSTYDGTSLNAHTPSSGADWEHNGWICDACQTTALVAPDGFTISDWS